MNEFGHQMTRIIPFGGEFKDSVTITLLADARIKDNGTVHYCLDGSEPTINSPIYIKPFKLHGTTIVKALTFDHNARAIGFTIEVEFTKVDTVTYPNWLSTLLNGKYIYEGKLKAVNPSQYIEIQGATLVNIADDPDLIDASGGYNSGCYIKSIDKNIGKKWLDIGLDKNWIIQELNEVKINNIKELEQYLKNHFSETIVITAVKNYNTKRFMLKLK